MASGKTVTNRRVRSVFLGAPNAIRQTSLQALRMLLETERVQVLINQASENRHAEMLDGKALLRAVAPIVISMQTRS